ncbi:MAG TPA: DUF998 domain-containing protein [Methanoregulaceae archaeon]|nr:DUF998 domain-containing protein [Methanoregulaceae archaeon]
MRKNRFPCQVAAACGMAAPLLFAVTTVAIGLATPGYDPVTQLVSELGIPGTPYATAMNSVGLIMTGILISVFASAVHSVLSGGWKGALGAVLVAVAGISFVAMGIFHCDKGCIPTTSGGSLHLLFGMVALAAGLSAALLFSLVKARERGWNGYWQYSLFTGVLILVMLPLLLLHPDKAGLVQRILIGLIFLWMEVLALRAYVIFRVLPDDQNEPA